MAIGNNDGAQIEIEIRCIRDTSNQDTYTLYPPVGYVVQVSGTLSELVKTSKSEHLHKGESWTFSDGSKPTTSSVGRLCRAFSTVDPMARRDVSSAGSAGAV